MPAPVLRIGGMLELLQNVILRLKDVWSTMTLNQKVVSGTVIAALVGVAFFLTTLTEGVSEYTLLFAELDARSASEITAQLDDDNIPYKIADYLYEVNGHYWKWLKENIRKDKFCQLFRENNQAQTLYCFGY